MIEPTSHVNGPHSLETAEQMEICELRKGIQKAVKAHNEVTSMIARYLIASKGHVADSWMEGFIECGAITYDASYPTGFIEAVKL